MSSSRASAPLWITLLLFIFFLSGAAGLVYEVVWLRYLTLMIGVTAPAVSTVLGVFMAGLGIGSALASRFLQNRNPFLFYAICEFGIAIFGFASPYLLEAVQPVAIAAKQQFEGGAALILARAAIVSIVLLPPAILMGATLPALAKGAALLGSRAGVSVGCFYSANTLGAVAGTLAAAFYCIEAFGMRGSINAAVLVNVIVGIAAFAIGKTIFTKSDDNITTATITTTPPENSGTPGLRLRALWIVAMSGAAALACEGLWTRYLIYAIGDNSAYAFAEMLAIFLLGIAIGSAAMAPFADKISNPMRAIGWIQALAATACVVSAGVLETPGRGGGLVTPFAEEYTVSFTTFVLHGMLATAKVVFIPTLLFGATFPLVARIVIASRETAGAGSGRLLAWNTGGAIIGAVASGFVLLPLLGFEKGMLAAASLNLAAALLAFAAPREGVSIKFTITRLVPFLSSILLFTGASIFLLSKEGAGIRALVSDRANERALFYEDGSVSSVGVVEDKNTGFRIIYVNGDAQASTDPSGMIHLRMLGHLPALLHADPKSALVICCGAGVTLGSLASHPLETLELCELNPTIAKLNQEGMFDGGNGGVFRDPRLKITIDDGRNHLLSTQRTYDLITTDPIDPDDAGVTSLYCEEFYRLVDSRLNPGGTACQWLTSGYGIDVYKSLIQAFRRVFPDCFLYDADFTTVIVGRKPGGAPVPFSRLERAFDDPNIVRSLADVGIDDAYEFLALQIGGPREIEAFCGDAPANSDDRPIAETLAPKTVWGVAPGSSAAKEKLILTMRNLDRSAWVADWGPAHEEKLKVKFDAFERAFEARLLSRTDPEVQMQRILARLRSFTRDAPRSVELMAGFDYPDYKYDGTDNYKKSDPEFEELFQSARELLISEKRSVLTSTLAIAGLREALARRPSSARASLALAYAEADAHHPAGAIEALFDVLKKSRWGGFNLKGFSDIQIGRLVEQCGDPERGAAARTSLQAFTGRRDLETPEACTKWWAANRNKAFLDPETRRIGSR